MISLARAGLTPASLPLPADDILEFHVARLLILLSNCGISGRIDGLTKMAKLDFFLRYPAFFEVARLHSAGGEMPTGSSGGGGVESAMIRFHYGPWDARYYHVLAALEGTGLITVTKHKKMYRLILTAEGKDRAAALSAHQSYASVVNRAREIKAVFGGKSGNYLKDLIYRIFDEEVGARRMGEVIER